MKEQEPNRTEQLRLFIVGEILSGQFEPGAKLPSERELAESSGASRVTVRRAYDQLEAAGIILRNRPRGTRVADSFRAHPGPLESIGLITTLPHDFSGRFVEAVSRHARAADALLVLGIPEPDTGGEQLAIAVKMAARGVKDLIIWGADRSFDFRVFERLLILGANMTFFDQVVPGPFADYVGLDNRAALEALIGQAEADGAAHFRFLTRSDLNVDTNAEREAAFLDIMQKIGTSFDIVRLPRTGGALPPFPAAAPAACICVNAPLLQSVFRAPLPGVRLYCVDRPPSVPGTPVTGYRQPIDAMAREAVDSLRRQRKGREPGQVRRFAGELVTI